MLPRLTAVTHRDHSKGQQQRISLPICPRTSSLATGTGPVQEFRFCTRTTAARYQELAASPSAPVDSWTGRTSARNRQRGAPDVVLPSARQAVEAYVNKLRAQPPAT